MAPVTAPSAGTISGTAPTGWTAMMSNTSGLTVANSQVASALTGRRMDQMRFTGSYTVTGAASPSATFNHYGRLYQNVLGSALPSIAAGDEVEALIEFEIDAGNSAIALPHLQFRWKGSANYNSAMQMGEGFLPDEAISGVLRSPAHRYVPADLPLAGGDVTLSVFGLLRNTNCTYNPDTAIRFGRVAVQKLEG